MSRRKRRNQNSEIEKVGTETAISSNITNSFELAKYLSTGKALNSEIPAISSAQQDMKAYLSLYARSQLIRIEKLTNYLDQLEAKMMDNVDSYDPRTFLSAMQTLQSSLASAIELVKMIGTDDKYLSIIYNDNKSYIENMQVNNKIDLGLSRESRDKLRSVIDKLKLENFNTPIETTTVKSQDIDTSDNVAT